MTTGNNRKVSFSPRKFGVSRTIRNVSPPLGKSEDPKQKGFLNRPWRGGKTPWDWLDLFAKLAIPLVVVLATIGFGWWQVHLADVQHQQDQQRATDQQQATILQTYLDNIQDLLLNHNLRNSKPTDDVVILARARTLAALPGLNSWRKGLLLKFIYDARLIGFGTYSTSISIAGSPPTTPTKPVDPIFSLSGADLSHVDLHDADLRGADMHDADLSDATLERANLGSVNLSDANLSGAYLYKANLLSANLYFAYLYSANLSDANLSDADLWGAYLYKANLSRAMLFHADLSYAELRSANLSRADLSYATLYQTQLSDASFFTQQQLDQVYTCKDANLPPGLTCHHNQSPP